MSLANENDLIIPGTVGTISAAVKEANRHLDRYREHIVQDENKNKNIVLVCHSGIIKCLICYIKQIPLKDIMTIKLNYGQITSINYENEKYTIY